MSEKIFPSQIWQPSYNLCPRRSIQKDSTTFITILGRPPLSFNHNIRSVSAVSLADGDSDLIVFHIHESHEQHP